MLNNLPSPTDKPNPDFVQSERKGREDNVKWIKRNFSNLAGEEGAKGLSYLVLIGGSEKAYFHTRVAQGHLRHDMSPSHWSHVALLKGSTPTSTSLAEVSLEPIDGFGYPPSDNAIQDKGSLNDYASRSQFPNVAILRLPVKLSNLKKTLVRFKKQRVDLDCVELTLLWLGYVWGVGRAHNPLFDGYGIPSAAFIEAICSANDFDLTPGMESRACTPEAIWQSARWWHEYHKNQLNSEPIKGMWHTEHFLGK